MAKENTTSFIILGLLNHEDSSGYDIKKKIDYMISRFWEVGYGQLYPTLRQLEKDGMVTKRTGENSKGPEKSVYSITAKGREALKHWLNVPGTKEYTKYEILLKLFFGNMVSFSENVERIVNFKERYVNDLKMIQMYKTNLEKVIEEEDDHLYYFLTVLFGEFIYKAYIEWADEAEKLLKNHINTNNYKGC